jgi:hypothetical protein
VIGNELTKEIFAVDKYKVNRTRYVLVTVDVFFLQSVGVSLVPATSGTNEY